MATIAVEPDVALRQRMIALERANDIRGRRSKLKRDLKASRVYVVSLIADPPDWMLTMTTLELLMATPKLGRVKANRMLSQTEIAPSKALGSLTSRQRQVLIDALTGISFTGRSA